MFMPIPALPKPPSWFPGHMTLFLRQLPVLLAQTDVVLELRDSRLPLTSINSNLEDAIRRWQASRGRFQRLTPSDPTKLIGTGSGVRVCERIIVFNKRDLVPEWGFEPFRRAMANKFPDQHVLFASWNKPRDIQTLSNLLVSLAKRNPYAVEMNVLVVGMPNVGKSTLLNALRNTGISGRTPKALRTSSNPGHTRVIPTRLKISEDPLIYSYDSPGVMLPFLGQGAKGAERGVKLALMAGIKEGLYDMESLAEYLLYRLNVLNPMFPAYLELLPPSTSPTTNLQDFLNSVSLRHGMIKRGNQRDLQRAAVRFVKWWRDEGGLKSASVPSKLLISGPSVQLQRQGWGLDFEWTLDGTEVGNDMTVVQHKMEDCIDAHIKAAVEEKEEHGGVSSTQMKKLSLAAKLAGRVAKRKARKARAASS